MNGSIGPGARAQEILDRATVPLAPELVAVTAIGPDGTEAAYREALAVALRHAEKPKRGNLSFLRLATDGGIICWDASDASESTVEDDIIPETESMVESDFHRQAADFALAAREAGHNDLANAAVRASNGMDKPHPEITTAPVDLWQRYEAPDLPRDVLPPVIERFAFEHGATMGADPAGIAMSALAVCAAAITDEIELQVKRHDPTWRESARLWVGLVGLPSTKKSPIMRSAMAPLRRIDKTLCEESELARQDWAKLPKAERDVTPMPRLPRKVVEDATVEALQEVLKASPSGVLSVQDELSGWFGAMDKYAPGKGGAADRAFWLKAFNGGSYTLDRVTRGSSLIPNLSIGLLGGIQPEPLRKIAGDTVDDGLIQRFLPVVLRPANVGKDAPAGDAVAAYERLIERLSRLRPSSGPGNLSGSLPVRFSDKALIIRERLEAEHADLVCALEAVSPKLAAHFGKHDGIFARLCLLWHCIETEGQTPDIEIASDIAERVAAFMDSFLRSSAIAFYAGQLGMTAGHEDLMAIAAYVVSEGLQEVDARAVQRAGQRFKSVTADEARRPLERLESLGWLEPMAPRQKSAAPRWSVNPAVHSLFAERGRTEKERRAVAQAAIYAALKN